MEAIKLSSAQEETLAGIVSTGKTSVEGFNIRTLKALEGKGLVKLIEQKKGTFVSPTAKGKKVLN